MRRLHTLCLHLGTAGALVAVDLWSKAAIFRHLGAEIITRPDGPTSVYAERVVVLFPGFALEAAMNPGAFNGMLASVGWLLLAISVVAVLGTLAIAVVPKRMPVPISIALGLIAGGAAGNFYDRLTYGAVRDFVKWYYRDLVWPNFNLADSGIVIGVSLILWCELASARREKRAARAAVEGSAAAGEGTPSPGAER
jgi:signal peptidase II